MTARIQFNDIADYAKVMGAKNRVTEATDRDNTASPAADGLLQQLNEQGYIIVEGVLSQADVEIYKQEVLGLLGPTGRHSFEGFKTQRIYSLLQKTLLCNPLVEHPMILGLLDRLLQANYLLSQVVAINILPGEERQLVHHDDAFYLVPRPRPALSVAAIWALDDFNEENGGTFVIPGSHQWPDRTPTEAEKNSALSVVMPAGSVVFFLGTLWHGGGANTSNASRLGLTAQYCEPWCRTVENCFLSIPQESVKQCSEKVQSMLGYSLHGPFMGYVDDAVHPARRLK